MEILEILKAVFFGVVQGITEWLPISSTGHMILIDEFIHFNVSDAFKEMFFVVIQFGSILAVVVLFWDKLFPFKFKGGLSVKPGGLALWGKILVASIPAGVVGVLFEDTFNRLFSNYQTVAIALIVFGVLFLVVEHYNKSRTPKVTSLADITYSAALFIGVFQLIAAVFPGTSRSGATIIAGLILGLSRTVAAEFTFFLAVPAMAGASLLKLLKFGFDFSSTELVLLLIGLVVALGVSMLVIRFLMAFIKKHDFRVFGWYRIALGVLVLVYFIFIGSR